MEIICDSCETHSVVKVEESAVEDEIDELILKCKNSACQELLEYDCILSENPYIARFKPTTESYIGTSGTTHTPY